MKVEVDVGFLSLKVRTVSVDVKSNTGEEVGSKGKEDCSIVSDCSPSRAGGVARG